jgi:hypothetical protein
VDPLLSYDTESLAEFNINAVLALSAALGFRSTKFYRQSELGIRGAGTQLLVDLVRAAKCTAYLAGGGAGGYQEDGLFAANDVQLVPQNFHPVPYGVGEEFIPGLSIIDYFMKAFPREIRPS